MVLSFRSKKTMLSSMADTGLSIEEEMRKEVGPFGAQYPNSSMCCLVCCPCTAGMS